SSCAIPLTMACAAPGLLRNSSATGPGLFTSRSHPAALIPTTLRSARWRAGCALEIIWQSFMKSPFSSLRASGQGPEGKYPPVGPGTADRRSKGLERHAKGSGEDRRRRYVLAETGNDVPRAEEPTLLRVPREEVVVQPRVQIAPGDGEGRVRGARDEKSDRCADRHLAQLGEVPRIHEHVAVQ